MQPTPELPDSEIFALIFHPGFSTADKITDVSGRGVGMDVVRKQVQKLRGRVDVISKAGQGTTFLLKLPLTLAIIDGLVVGVGDQRYIVPIFAVREMLKPAEEAISTIHGRQEMAMVRGTLLPGDPAAPAISRPAPLRTTLGVPVDRGRERRQAVLSDGG